MSEIPCVPAQAIPRGDDRLMKILRDAVKSSPPPTTLAQPMTVEDMRESFNRYLESAHTFPEPPTLILPPRLHDRIARGLGKPRFTYAEAMEWAIAEDKRNGIDPWTGERL